MNYNDDVLLAITYLNKIMAEQRDRLWPEEIDDLERVTRVLDRIRRK